MRGPTLSQFNLPQMYVFAQPGTTSFVVPSTSTGVGRAVLYGGGGAGAGSAGNQYGSLQQYGGGGGGGATIKANIFATPGSTLTITIGMGGTGGTGILGVTDQSIPAGSCAGSSGTASIVDGLLSPFSTLIAGGGWGSPGLGETAIDGPFNGQNNCIGGTGGVTSPTIASNSMDFVAMYGQYGINGGDTNNNTSGAGGGCPNGGYGGQFATNGDSNNTATSYGHPGIAPGGGGGGAGASQGGSNLVAVFTGGNGANGLVILTF
jgi:hypothetical protein